MGVYTEAKLMVAVPVQKLGIDIEETEYEDMWEWFNKELEYSGLTHTSPWYDCDFEEGYLGFVIDSNQSLEDIFKAITEATGKLKQYTNAESKFDAYVDVW